MHTVTTASTGTAKPYMNSWLKIVPAVRYNTISVYLHGLPAAYDKAL